MKLTAGSRRPSLFPISEFAVLIITVFKWVKTANITGKGKILLYKKEKEKMDLVFAD